MDKIIVRGGHTRLSGSVEIEGAKNAVLPLIAASLLPSHGQTELHNVPILSDVYTMGKVVEHLNIAVEFDEDNKTLYMQASESIAHEAPYEYVSQMRASIVVMGPILARTGCARVSMPGGDAIGSRPIDLHLKGFEAMGATISQSGGYIEARANQLHGAHYYMDFPSVGATQNLMMAATLAKGVTTLENVAKEPEIVNLANLLNKMGANVKGAGTDTLVVKGVDSLQGATHRVIQDRIEAGTFMVAAAMTGGNVLIKEAIREHNRPLISKLVEAGARVIEESGGIRVVGPDKLKPVHVKTLPHPGYPTDLQAQMTALMAVADGESIMHETVFENRFMHLSEMRRMGLEVEINRSTAIIQGGKPLTGAQVVGTDLRAAATLILIGMMATGETEVSGLDHLDRGYYQYHLKLASLGADIERIGGQDV